MNSRPEHEHAASRFEPDLSGRHDACRSPVQSCTLVSTGPQTCAVCGATLAAGAAADSPLYPFCSQRCRQIDLLRWTQGRYAIVDTLTLEQLLEAQLHSAGDVEEL